MELEYSRGILHAKMLVVDGQLSIIGSANADIRSFRFSFEVTVQIYGGDFAREVEDVFFADLEQGKKLTRSWLNRSPGVRFVENLLRLCSPLL